MPLSNPVQTFTIKSAVQKAQNEDQKILVFGQKTAAGTATSLSVINDIGDDYETLLGADSIAASIVRAVRRVETIANEQLRVDVLPLDDGTASVAAAGDVTYAGTATETGVLTIDIGSELNHRFEVTVAVDDTASDIASAFETAINADPKVPVTALAAVGAVGLTAVNKGYEGNHIAIQTSGSVAGITATITAMVSGAGDVDAITDKTAFAAISDNIRYQGIVYPGTYDTTNDYAGLREFVDARFPVDNRVLDGQAFAVRTEDLSTIKADAATLNNESITLIVNKPTTTATLKGGALVELNYVMAAYFVAIRALRLTEGAQIGQFIVGAFGSLDDVGGMSLASLPYMNTPFTNLIATADVSNFWTDAEARELTGAGVSVIGNNLANNDVIAGQMVTTYLKDSTGTSDVTFKYLNYFDTLTTIREYFYNNLKERFAQSRLVESDLVPNRNEANRSTVVGYMLNLYQDLANAALVEKGTAATKFFSNNLEVTIDKATGKVTVLMLVAPVTQLREIDTTMQVVFSINL